MFVKETMPPITARHPVDAGRVWAGFGCFSGETVNAASGRGRGREQLARAMCSWPARWLSVLAAVFTLSSWTGGNVGAPSRVLIVSLVLAGVLAVTTRPGWQLLRRGARPGQRVPAVGVAAAAVFALLVLQVVLAGPLTGVDLAVSRLAAGLSQGTLYRLAQLLSALAQVAVQAAALLALAAVLARRWRPLLTAGSAVVLVCVFVGAGKVLLGRGQPPWNVRALHVGGSSFPSGHTCTAVVLGGTAAWLIGRGATQLVRRLSGALAAGWAVLIGVDRLYLDVHWLTDVLAGWALGTALLCLLITVDRLLSRLDDQPAQRHDLPDGLPADLYRCG